MHQYNVFASFNKNTKLPLRMQIPTARLYTFQFLLLCLGNFFFSASFTMILPELPAYLTSLGGEDYKGLIIGLFTLMAGLSRPFSGKLSDTIGRVPVMIFGALTCIVCSFFYPILTTVSGFLFLRFLHGFSTGFHPTASSAYGADITPIPRRGEAMGMLSISSNIGMSAGPFFGSLIANAYTIETMFYVSSSVGILAVLLLAGMKETLTNKQPFSFKLLHIKWNEIAEYQALAPAIATFFTYFCFGAFLTIIPDQADHVGMANRGNAFAAYTLLTIASRLFAGRISDRFGRVIMIKIAIIPLAFSVAMFGFVSTPIELLIAAGGMGFSLGLAGPAIFAWAIDRSADERRGRALGTVYIAVEAGIGFAAVISAAIFANKVENFKIMWLFVAAVTLLCLVYLQFGTYEREKNGKI